MSSDPRIGTVLGHYRIQDVLGRGGMGVVYLAEHLRLKKDMALKVLPPELADDVEFRRRFERESQLAASLDHPNIVQVHDAGEVDGLLYIAMRYVKGTDLAQVIRAEGPLEPARALSILSQAADALDEAHAQGLVHRDVKPANILLAPSRRGPADHVYLTDFGLAKHWASGSRLTRSGFFVGTIHYSAPEQFSAESIDGRTDVYSLGCVLYESLTGVVPFPRHHEPAVMYAHMNDPPPPVTDQRADLPAGLNQVIATAMAKSREDRYGTCGALVSAARQQLEGLPPLAPTVTRPGPPATGEADTPTEAVSAGGPAAPTRRVREAPPRRPGRAVWIALAGIMAAALGVGGFFLVRELTGGTPRANDGSPSTEPTTDGSGESPNPPEVHLLAPVSVTAVGTSPPGMDACGTPVPFDPDRVVDGDPETAWRAPGRGQGAELTLTFESPMHITRLGMIPGYAKIDPCDGTDRFEENRKVRKAYYLFDDGSTVIHELAPIPEIQYIDIDVVTTEIDISILEATEHGGRDYTPISEVEVYGEPAA